jgi:hypothetical protein
VKDGRLLRLENYPGPSWERPEKRLILFPGNHAPPVTTSD